MERKSDWGCWRIRLRKEYGLWPQAKVKILLLLLTGNIILGVI